MEKQLRDLVSRIFGRGHSVANRSLVTEDFVVVTAGHCLVTKEVDFFELVPADVIQAEAFVPAVRKDVDAYLSADRKSQALAVEFLLQSVHEILAHVVRFVELGELVSFLLRAASPDRANVQHAFAKLDKRAAFARQLQARHVLQAEVYQLLQEVVSEVVLDAFFAD